MADRPERPVALVTGGSRGIGRAIALALVRSGHDVAVGDLDGLDGIRAELEAAGAPGAAVRMDVTDRDSVAEAVAAVTAELGAPSVLVNNAGVASAFPFLKLPLEEWTKNLAVNSTGPFLVTQVCLSAMIDAGWGRVVNIGSTAALHGYPYTTHYTASKHAVLGLTRALAMEVAKKGVTVNCVCPGFVDTEMTQRSVDNIVSATGRSTDEARKSLASQNPQGRLVTPEEVAAAVVYLASDEARGVNGHAMVVGG